MIKFAQNLGSAMYYFVVAIILLVAIAVVNDANFSTYFTVGAVLACVALIVMGTILHLLAIIAYALTTEEKKEGEEDEARNTTEIPPADAI